MIRAGDRVTLQPEHDTTGLQLYAARDEAEGLVLVAADLGLGDVNPLCQVRVDMIASHTTPKGTEL